MLRLVFGGNKSGVMNFEVRRPFRSEDMADFL